MPSKYPDKETEYVRRAPGVFVGPTGKLLYHEFVYDEWKKLTTDEVFEVLEKEGFNMMHYYIKFDFDEVRVYIQPKE